jgi:hypothetical protein
MSAYGPLMDIAAAPPNVRFREESGHGDCTAKCPLPAPLAWELQLLGQKAGTGHSPAHSWYGISCGCGRPPCEVLIGRECGSGRQNPPDDLIPQLDIFEQDSSLHVVDGELQALGPSYVLASQIYPLSNAGVLRLRMVAARF